MSQNATSNEHELSAAQERVVEALVAGQTITTAAQGAGVTRQTIHRWLRDSYEFQAALNAARRDLREEVENRIQSIATDAIEVVSKAVGDGDARAGIAVLRGLGLLDGKASEIGSESPELLEKPAKGREVLESMLSFG